ncbi:hypothetical protein BGW38_009857 [Lunasporangiospora selenospora]|uniref:Pre-rRNA-processing protein n=1 Tax=Lunasporangiospora selenospora TaxID=979761 RepID=A0A9P6FX67_9FUNG|nr:hypothetical protein BGW38_009857 [Lunasporangiospora selenospora]
MPKSSSKKKKEKNADFKKTKLKVGKKKVVADSFTDTSFKSRAISLPSQSISHDKSTALTNARNVTFAELLTQLKHYSPGTRKDALLGLRDLFHRHPHLLPLHLGTLMNAVVRLLIDDSSSVRKALQNFLGEFIPLLHPRDIHPFLPLLIVYNCSAMTHILEDIREDALKFMDLWVACGGQVVVNGFWDKIIPNYLSLLTSDSNASNASKLASSMSFSASSSSGMVGSGQDSSISGSGQKVVSGATTSKNAPGSLRAKCDVLHSLAGFLQEGLGGGGEEKDAYWFLRNFLGTAHARKTFNAAQTRHGQKRKRALERDGSGSDSDASEDSSDQSSEDEGLSSSAARGQKARTSDPEDVLDTAPVLDFTLAQKQRLALATFPLEPFTAGSSLGQTVFGQTTAPGRDHAANITIKMFPQQGGAIASSATGAGATPGSGNALKTEGENFGGAQKRLANIKSLITSFHPLLLSIWLDTAPSVFGSTTAIHSNEALTVVRLTLMTWGILWRAALAKPKKREAETKQEKDAEAEEEKWIDEYLQSLLRHVLVYFPFGKDTVGVTDSKVAAVLQDMNITYCELTSLFLLGSGVGQMRLVPKESLKKQALKQASMAAKVGRDKNSRRPAVKKAKKRAAEEIELDTAESSSDYDSEEESNSRRSQKDTKQMVSIQVKPPAWADQVVDFVLDALGFDRPDDERTPTDGPQMTNQSTDFKPQHLVALLPTLWTMLNCLETHRKEWVFEALMAFFDFSHAQSQTKSTLLSFVSSIIKRAREEKIVSITKLSARLTSSLLKLPKLLWDLGIEKVETSKAALDLLAWVAIIAGDRYAGAEDEEARSKFVATLQSYMSLFFSATVAGRGGSPEQRTIMGPFVRLPVDLQKRAIEVVFYTGILANDSEEALAQTSKSAGNNNTNVDAQKSTALLASVRRCCDAEKLPYETKLYIQETLRIPVS